MSYKVYREGTGHGMNYTSSEIKAVNNKSGFQVILSNSNSMINE
jgi:hypothetical protein